LKSVREGAVISYRRNILNVFFACLVLYIACQLRFGLTECPYQTYLALKLASSLFGLFFVVTNVVDTRRSIDKILFLITLAGFLVSVLGIIQLVTSTDKIYWVRSFPDAGFFASFIYENHFACYISIVALITLGGLLVKIYETKEIGWDLSLRQIFVDTVDNLLNRRMLFILLSFAVMAASLFLSKSIGGISFFLLALLFFMLSAGFVRNKRKTAWILFFGLLTAYLILQWIDIGRVSKEFKTALSYGFLDTGRVAVFLDSIKIIKDHLLTGIGIGAFSCVFPLYRSTPAVNFYEYLHNDIMQFLMETGLLGSIIILIPLSVFLARLIISVNNTSSRYKRCICAGALSVFFYLSLHASVDFVIHNGAVLSLSVILLALSLLVSRLKPTEAGAEISMRTVRVFSLKNGSLKASLYVLFTIIFIYLSFILAKPLIAYILIDKEPSLSSFDKAIKLDSANDDLYFRRYLFIFHKATERNYVDREWIYNDARSSLAEALKLNPYKTSYVIAQGELEIWRADFERASFYFNKASMMEPHNPFIQMTRAYGIFWRVIHEKDEAIKKALLKKGLVYYSAARYLSGNAVTLKTLLNNKGTYDYLEMGLQKEGVTVY
jgi:O-antigen ligase